MPIESPAEIRESVALYVTYRSDELKGALREEGYFLMGGECLEEGISSYKIMQGWAIDILADRMTSGRGWGWWVSGSKEQAQNPNIFKLRKLGEKVNRGIDIDLSDLELKTSETGLSLAVPPTPQKEYLDALRSEEGFKKYAAEHRLGWQHFGTSANQEDILRRIGELFSRDS